MTSDFRINPLAAVYADRQRCKGIGSTAAQKAASQYLLAAAVDPTLDSAGDPRETASSGLMLKRLPNYKPDISHATKSGHFNLLRTGGVIIVVLAAFLEGYVTSVDTNHSKIEVRIDLKSTKGGIGACGFEPQTPTVSR